MESEILRGKPVADAIVSDICDRIQKLSHINIQPCMALIRFGDNSDDVVYESSIIKQCDQLNILTTPIHLRSDMDLNEVKSIIDNVNNDSTIHGVMVFRPFPTKQIEKLFFNDLLPAKDLDGITASSIISLYTDREIGFPPCTAESCIALLDYYGINIEGKRAVVIGRSQVIGKPVSLMLLNRNATVTICHSKTAKLTDVCREADILISAIGKPSFLGKNYVKEDQIVIDVGINSLGNGKICGDVAFSEVSPIVTGITPVPGGVGRVTTAILIKHLIKAVENMSVANSNE